MGRGRLDSTAESHWTERAGRYLWMVMITLSTLAMLASVLMDRLPAKSSAPQAPTPQVESPVANPAWHIPRDFV